MSILDAIGGLLTSGGLTGLASGAMAVYGKLHEKKLDIEQARVNNEQQTRQWKYEVYMTRENAKHEAMLADKKLLITKQVGADAILVEAIKSEATLAATNVYKWVSSVRALHRIVLTYVLIGTAIYMHASAGTDTTEQQILLTAFVTNAAAAAISFWYGSKVIAPDKRR